MMNTASDFLRFVRPDGPWTLTAIEPDAKAPIETRTFSAEEMPALEQWVADRDGKRNIYWGANPTLRSEAKKASRDNIKCMSLLHVDLDPRVGEDIEAEQSRICNLLTVNLPQGVPPPSVVIFSGGGYQALWLLEEPFAINGEIEKAEEAARYNMQLELLLGGDATHDVSRILRLPFTMNIPGEKKAKKGRKAVRASVLCCNLTRYSLAQFIPAQRLQSVDSQPGDTRRVEISGNIARLNGVDDLDKYHLPDKLKVLIVEGMESKYPSRSEALWYVCCEMVRCGVPAEIIFSVITDPDFGISASVLEKGVRAERYAKQQIVRAMDEAEEPKLREYNERHAVIKHHNNGCIVVTELYDHQKEQYQLHRATVQSFFQAYANDKFPNTTRVPKKTKTGDVVYEDIVRNVKAPQWWFEHKNRREYDRIVFAPARDVPNCYNLWRGFSCEAIPSDKHESFLSHVYDNICSKNDEHYQYLMGWMARAVQRPYEPGYSAVILCGGQGVGKSFFAENFGSLFGTHYLKVAHASQLVGRFNGHMQKLSVLFADEGFYAGDKQHSSVLKDLITSDTLSVENKFEQVDSVFNYIHLIMASNASWVVPAEHDSRRFFVLDVSKAQTNAFSYFNQIAQELDNGGREALLAHLLSYDISTFNVREIPHTNALARQKEMSLSTEDSWWEEKLEDGLVFSIDSEWSELVSPQSLYEDYLQYAQNARTFRPLSKGALFLYLEKATNGKIATVRRYPSKYARHKPRFWQLPTLDECRAAWDERFRQSREWDAGEVLEDHMDEKNVF